MGMQYKRRHFHFTVVLTSYTLLLLIARWAFFSEVVTAIDNEPNIDDQFNCNVSRIFYSVPLRFHRSANTGDWNDLHGGVDEMDQGRIVDHDFYDAKQSENETVRAASRKLRFLERVFTNFLHP